MDELLETMPTISDLQLGKFVGGGDWDRSFMQYRSDAAMAFEFRGGLDNNYYANAIGGSGSLSDRMPTSWVKWVVLCVSVLMGAILLFGFLIRYPDRVDGQISITATVAPVRLVANNNGRICLIKPNRIQIKKGDVISYIESGANYKHILPTFALWWCGRSVMELIHHLLSDY